LARQVILVTETSVTSLWSLERLINILRSMGIDPDRLRLVVNRWHRPDDEALKAFEKRMKLPIFERLPNDFKAVSRAVNMGAELSKGQNDQLVQKFRSLAARLGGGSATQPAAEAKRGNFLGLFSGKG
jgi:Flp pilus assembly CpaE family ATPase